MTIVLACTKTAEPIIPVPEEEEKKEYTEQEKSIIYSNLFARYSLDIYYLWRDEIAEALTSWKLSDDPVSKVESVRYADDRWTMMTNDYNSLINTAGGISKSFGWELAPYYGDPTMTTVVAVILWTYPGTPAYEAGLKRGDAIVKVKGSTMTPQTYPKIFSEMLEGNNPVSITIQDGSELTLTPAVIHADPVLVAKTFTLPGDRKVGYLHYTRFTLESCTKLIEVCKQFRQENVKDLILDMRYNPGGYVITEETLASMIAPEKEVKAGSIYERAIYNSLLSSILDAASRESRFTTEFKFKMNNTVYDYSTADANIGVENLYAIMTENTASASESILCGLMPYLPAKIYGKQSYGKFCTGILMNGTDFFTTYRDLFSELLSEEQIEEAGKYTSNTGMYIMESRYADKTGRTASMPEGISPDVEVDDRPDEQWQLGDPEERMLKAVLTDLGYEYPEETKSAPASAGRLLQPVEQERDESYGIRITLPSLPEGPISLR